MSNSSSTCASAADPRLDTFDHVVVLMLENRSFDNLLGFIYPDGVPKDAPASHSFDGNSLTNSNPVPSSAVNQPPDGSGRVNVTLTSDYHQPYPDPGEEYYHINTQLFNQPNGGSNPPYNLPPKPLPTPGMQGFVTDYIEKLGEPVSKLSGPPTFAQYSQIMQSFEPTAVPVLTTLAREFGVFDHWHCAVPSQTWCNRAFWHAGTSWGRVNNSPFDEWFKFNGGETIFNQISDSGSDLSWKVYHDTPFVSLTNIIHFHALDGHEFHFHSMDRFFEDCANGDLPSYSFLEPDFIFEHNDYHPSSAGKGLVDYETKPGSVLLGEQLVAKIYEAIKASTGKPGPNGPTGNTSQNTLLIITFDEHGGCYDHAEPIAHVTPPNLDGYPLEEGFGFDRSGIRVPMIMVSAHIAPNTVINTPMMHTAFISTMQAKWSQTAQGKFPQISDRQQSDELFTEVFTASSPRPASEWPEVYPPKQVEPSGTTCDDDDLGDLQQSIVGGFEQMLRAKGVEFPSGGTHTVKDAKAYLREAREKLDQLG